MLGASDGAEGKKSPENQMRKRVTEDEHFLWQIQTKKQQQNNRKETLRVKEQKLSKHSVHDKEKIGNIPGGVRRRRRRRMREAFREMDLGKRNSDE